MKKVKGLVVAMLAVVLSFTIMACNEPAEDATLSAEAKSFISAVNALPEAVGFVDTARLTDADNKYNLIPVDERKTPRVTAAKLTLEGRWALLNAKVKENEAAALAEVFLEAMKDLPAVLDLTLADKADVDAAKAEYDKLTPDAKETAKAIINEARLSALLKQIAVLETAVATDAAAVTAFKTAVAAIPATVAIADKAKVTAALDAYAKLSATALKAEGVAADKAKVDAASAQIGSLEAAAAFRAAVADLPSATTVDLAGLSAAKAKVLSALSQYNALNTAAKAVAGVSADFDKATELSAALDELGNVFAFISAVEALPDPLAAFDRFPAAAAMLLYNKLNATSKAHDDVKAALETLVDLQNAYTAAEAKVFLDAFDVLDAEASSYKADLLAAKGIYVLLSADAQANTDVAAAIVEINDALAGISVAEEAQIFLDAFALLPAFANVKISDYTAVVNVQRLHGALTGAVLDYPGVQAAFDATNNLVARIGVLTNAKKFTDAVAALPALERVSAADQGAINAAKALNIPAIADVAGVSDAAAVIAALEARIGLLADANAFLTLANALPDLAFVKVSHLAAVQAAADAYALITDQDVKNLAVVAAAYNKVLALFDQIDVVWANEFLLQVAMLPSIDNVSISAIDNLFALKAAYEGASSKQQGIEGVTDAYDKVMGIVISASPLVYDDAIATINRAFASYNEEDYEPDYWLELVGLAEGFLLKIENADQTVPVQYIVNVQGYKVAALMEMEAVWPNQQFFIEEAAIIGYTGDWELPGLAAKFAAAYATYAKLTDRVKDKLDVIDAKDSLDTKYGPFLFDKARVKLPTDQRNNTASGVADGNDNRLRNGMLFVGGGANGGTWEVARPSTGNNRDNPPTPNLGVAFGDYISTPHINNVVGMQVAVFPGGTTSQGTQAESEYGKFAVEPIGYFWIVNGAKYTTATNAMRTDRAYLVPSYDVKSLGSGPDVLRGGNNSFQFEFSNNQYDTYGTPGGNAVLQSIVSAMIDRTSGTVSVRFSARLVAEPDKYEAGLFKSGNWSTLTEAATALPYSAAMVTQKAAFNNMVNAIGAPEYTDTYLDKIIAAENAYAAFPVAEREFLTEIYNKLQGLNVDFEEKELEAVNGFIALVPSQAEIDTFEALKTEDLDALLVYGTAIAEASSMYDAMWSFTKTKYDDVLAPAKELLDAAYEEITKYISEQDIKENLFNKAVDAIGGLAGVKFSKSAQAIGGGIAGNKSVLAADDSKKVIDVAYDEFAKLETYLDDEGLVISAGAAAKKDLLDQCAAKWDTEWKAQLLSLPGGSTIDNTNNDNVGTVGTNGGNTFMRFNGAPNISSEILRGAIRSNRGTSSRGDEIALCNNFFGGNTFYAMMLKTPHVVGLQVRLHEGNNDIAAGTTAAASLAKATAKGDPVGYFWLIHSSKAIAAGASGYNADQFYFVPSINPADPESGPNYKAPSDMRYLVPQNNNAANHHNMYGNNPTDAAFRRIISAAYQASTGNQQSGTQANAIFHVVSRMVATEDNLDVKTGDWSGSFGYTNSHWNAPSYGTQNGIEVYKAPAKTAYNAGETLDTTGMSIVAVYNSNGFKIPTTNYTIEYQNGTAISAGDKFVTIKSGTYSVQVKVTVKNPIELRIEEGTVKKVYADGETFDSAGMKAFLVFEDGSPDVETTAYTVEYQNGNAFKQSDTFVTIKFGALSATVDVQIVTLDYIEITRDPSKMAYINGDKLELSGIKVEAFYVGETESVDITGLVSFSIADETVLNGSDYEVEVTVSYLGKSDSFTVTVKTLLNIAVKGDFTKTYNEGQTFDPTGMIVEATFSRGTLPNEVVTLASSDYTIAPTGALTPAHTANVVVTYRNGVTAAITDVLVKADLRIAPEVLQLVAGTYDSAIILAPPQVSGKTFEWSSSAPTIATVDNTGKITAVAAGIATISVLSTDNSYFGELEVRVAAASEAIEIKTAQEFLNIFTDPTFAARSKHYFLGNDINFAGVTISRPQTAYAEPKIGGNYSPTEQEARDGVNLAANYFNSSVTFFNGTFDGRGYALKNITMAASNSAAVPGNVDGVDGTGTAVGTWGNSLFGVVGYTGIIKNLSVIGYNSPQGADSGQQGVIAHANHGTIRNCYFENVTITGAGGDANGGANAVIIGQNYRIVDSCVVANAGFTAGNTGFYPVVSIVRRSVGGPNGDYTGSVTNVYALMASTNTAVEFCQFPATTTTGGRALNNRTATFRNINLLWAGTPPTGTSTNATRGTLSASTNFSALTGEYWVFPNGLMPRLINPDSPSQVFLSNTSLGLAAAPRAKQTATLIAQVYPTPAAITWTSSNEAVATVEDGVVTAVAVGTCTITATPAGVGAIPATCSVNVVAEDFSGLTKINNPHGIVAGGAIGSPADWATIYGAYGVTGRDNSANNYIICRVYFFPSNIGNNPTASDAKGYADFNPSIASLPASATLATQSTASGLVVGTTYRTALQYLDKMAVTGGPVERLARDSDIVLITTDRNYTHA